MPALTIRTEIHKDVLRRLADARLAEFEALQVASPPQYAGAFYLGGYAVEALLKCHICRSLNLDELPVAFHVHDLRVLLLFSGRYKEMLADAGVWRAFERILSTWSEARRYVDPPTLVAADCAQMSLWLNDPVEGVIPWLIARL